MSVSDNDFGFTLVSQSEFDEETTNLKVALNKAKKMYNQEAFANAKNIETIKNIMNIITPLLENLKLDPEKDYIKWSNRVEKINEIQNKLKNIMEN